MPFYPSVVLEVKSAFRIPTFRNYTLVNPQVSSPRDLGVRHFGLSVRMKLTPKSGKLKSSETLENSELNYRGQNTLR
jgi:hypothetical protein